MRSEVGVGWRISTDSAIGKWTFSPYLSAQLNNAKLTNYYFGVAAAKPLPAALLTKLAAPPI